MSAECTIRHGQQAHQLDESRGDRIHALRTYLAIEHIPRDPYSVTQLFLGQDVSDVMLNSSNADPVFLSDFSIVETASDGFRRAPLGIGQFLISDERKLICL